MVYEVAVPKYAEGAKVIKLKRWLHRKGEKVDAGSQIAEASTDKIAIYIEVPSSGYVYELRVNEGQQVEVGEVIATVSSEAPS